MVSNIKKGLSNINIRTNEEGHLKAVTACKVLDLEFKSYYNKDSMTNIISLVDMADNYRITIVTKFDKVMYVHMNNKVVRFSQIHNQFCSLDPKYNNVYTSEQFKEKFKENKENYDKNNAKVQMINTIKENLKYLLNS
jgi:hypothetical protein